MLSSFENFFSVIQQNPLIFYLFLAWVIVWKGIALWKAARNNHKYWYIALLIINLAGVLEILYIFVFSKRKLTNNRQPTTNN